MAATPSPNYADQTLLASDVTFQNRVRQSLLKAGGAIKSESPVTTPFHRERETFLVAASNQPDVFKITVAQSVVTDAGVIGDATVGGTVPLTSGNVAAQAALVTDAHLDTAISSLYNTFFRTPGN
jgi:hypothetical protein